MDDRELRKRANRKQADLKKDKIRASRWEVADQLDTDTSVQYSMRMLHKGAPAAVILDQEQLVSLWAMSPEFQFSSLERLLHGSLTEQVKVKFCLGRDKKYAITRLGALCAITEPVSDLTRQ